MSLIRIAFDVSLGSALLLGLSACRGDSTGDGADGSTGGTDTTASSETGAGDVLNCGEPESPPSAPEGSFLECDTNQECMGTLILSGGNDPKIHCPLTNAAFIVETMSVVDLPEFTLSLRHPLVEGSNSMPPGAFPLIIFQHGEGQEAQYYRAYWEAIVPLGVLVADGDFANDDNTQSHQTRPYTMRCIAEYLGNTQAASLNFDLVLAGHSRGGFAALRAAKFMLENPGEPAGFSLNGVWTLAPDATASEITVDDWIHPSLSTNVLVLQGSIENDAIGGALTHYERFGIEELGPDPGGEKTLVWVYDLTHRSWGGVDPLAAAPPQDHYGVLSSTQVVAKAQTIALGYVLPFVRRHLTGQPLAGDLDILRGTQPPPNVDDPSWWSHLDAWQTPEWYGRPVILTSRVDGCDADRLVIDDFARGPNIDLPPTSSEGWPVSMVPPGFATHLEVLADPLLQHHDLTSVMDVAWDSPGEIEWDLGNLDPSIAASRTHFSFRVANVLEAQSGVNGQCDVTSVHQNLAFVLELESEQGTYTRTISPIVQDSHSVAHPLIPNAPFCSWQNMMHEVVVPLAQACEGFPVQKVRFVFGQGAGSAAGRVFIDSLQLLSRPSEIGGCR